MTVRQPRYSKEEFARRGDEIYESQVRQQVEEGNQGRIIEIDSDSQRMKRSMVKLGEAVAKPADLL